MRVQYGTMEFIGIVEVGEADLTVGGIRCASFFYIRQRLLQLSSIRDNHHPRQDGINMSNLWILFLTLGAWVAHPAVKIQSVELRGGKGESGAKPRPSGYEKHRLETGISSVFLCTPHTLEKQHQHAQSCFLY